MGKGGKITRYIPAELVILDGFLGTKEGARVLEEELDDLALRLAEAREDKFIRTANAVQIALIRRRAILNFLKPAPEKPVTIVAAVSALAAIKVLEDIRTIAHVMGKPADYLAPLEELVSREVNQKDVSALEKKIKCLEEKLAAQDREIIVLKKQRRVLKEVLLLTCRLRQEAATLNKMVENIKRDEGIDVYALVQEKEE